MAEDILEKIGVNMFLKTKLNQIKLVVLLKISFNQLFGDEPAMLLEMG